MHFSPQMKRNEILWDKKQEEDDDDEEEDEVEIGWSVKLAYSSLSSLDIYLLLLLGGGGGERVECRGSWMVQ